MNVTVEVIQPFVFSYPVRGELGDYTEDRLVPGPDGYLVKRPMAFRRIEGFVEYSRPNAQGQMEVVTEGTGLMTVPKEVADTLIARGVVRAVDDERQANDGRTYTVTADPVATAKPPRTSRNRPVPIAT